MCQLDSQQHVYAWAVDVKGVAPLIPGLSASLSLSRSLGGSGRRDGGGGGFCVYGAGGGEGGGGVAVLVPFCVFAFE